MVASGLAAVGVAFQGWRHLVAAGAGAAAARREDARLSVAPRA